MLSRTPCSFNVSHGVLRSIYAGSAMHTGSHKCQTTLRTIADVMTRGGLTIIALRSSVCRGLSCCSPTSVTAHTREPEIRTLDSIRLGCRRQYGP